MLCSKAPWHSRSPGSSETKAKTGKHSWHAADGYRGCYNWILNRDDCRAGLAGQKVRPVSQTARLNDRLSTQITQHSFHVRRYCLVTPRFPWYEDGQVGLSMSYGKPSFSMVCYKEAGESQPVTVIPLDNARVVVESGGLTEAGILVSSRPHVH